MVQFTEFD